jgi:hypothetical protein
MWFGESGVQRVMVEWHGCRGMGHGELGVVDGTCVSCAWSRRVGCMCGAR